MKMIRSNLSTLMGKHKIMSIHELSRQTGLSRPTLTKMFNNETERFDSHTMMTLCDFFNVPLSELIEIVEVEDKKEDA